MRAEQPARSRRPAQHDPTSRSQPALIEDLPEIPAAKHRLGDNLVYWALVRWPLWNSFERVRVQVHGPLPRPPAGPLIVYLNHPAWWDGHMCFLIQRLLLRRRYDGYLMMEDLQLRAYRFFTWCGAWQLSHSLCFTPAATTPAWQLLQARTGALSACGWWQRTHASCPTKSAEGRCSWQLSHDRDAAAATSWPAWQLRQAAAEAVAVASVERTSTRARTSSARTDAPGANGSARA